MARFMNDELRRIRDSLKCAHCGCTFVGSDSQAWKVKYEGKRVCCSPICRKAHIANQLKKPIPMRGPCKHCGEMFKSKTSKLYCSIDCYINSEQFKEVSKKARKKSLSAEARRKQAEKNRTGEWVECLNCGQNVYSKPSKRKKYCSQACYRAYLARRFDRWVANPEEIALPQCYDEFLDKEELSCIVEGCDWHGRHLSLHVNLCHGAPCSDFKRAAGFNLGTGVISRGLRESYSNRSLEGVAKDPAAFLADAPECTSAQDYKSLEGKEHRKKARAILNQELGPLRWCRFCNAQFRQSTPFGKTIYCSVECRNKYYYQNNHNKQSIQLNSFPGPK